MKVNKKGLTLIEIIAVIAIISILFVLLIPAVSSGFEKTKELGVKNDLKNYETAIKTTLMKKKQNFKIDELNENIEKKYKFNNGISEKENSYGKKYELTVLGDKKIVISTKNDKKNPKYYLLVFLKTDEGYESSFLGFDEEITNEEKEKLTTAESGTDEYGEYYDYDRDGIPDAWDTDGDGKVDAWNKDGSGEPDAWDFDGDGTIDEEILDTNESGNDNGLVVTFSPETSENWSNSIETTVSIEPTKYGIKKVQYQWSNSTTSNENEWLPGTTEKTQTFTLDSGEGSYYLHIKVTDKIGTTKQARGGVYKIDNISPTISLDNNENTTFSKTHTVNVSSRDEGSGIAKTEYIWSTSTSTPTSGWITATNNAIKAEGYNGKYYLYVKVTDNAGNVANSKTGLFYFDNTNPTISFATNGNSTYAKSVSTNVTISDTNSIDKKYYAWTTTSTKLASSSTSWTVYTGDDPISKSSGTGDYYLQIKAIDTAGNELISVSNVFKLDNTAPTIDFATNGNSKYIKTASTNVTVTDTKSLDKKYYAWTTSSTKLASSSTSWTSYTTTAPIEKSGVTGDYHLQIKAVDTAGNELISVSNVFKLDNTAPTIVFAINGNSGYAKSASTDVAVADTKSLDKKYYAWTTTSTKLASSSTSWTVYTGNDPISKSSGTGNYYLQIKAVDEAGNELISVSNVFKLDNTAPTVSFSQESNTIWVESQSVDIEVNDDNAGVEKIQYAWSTSTIVPTTWETGESVVTQTVTKNTGEGKFYLYVKVADNLGNSKVIKSGQYYIDAVAPNIFLNTNSNTTYAQKQTVYFTKSDDGSGIVKTECKATSSSTPPTSDWLILGNNSVGCNVVSGTGKIYMHLRATDAMGHTTTITSTGQYYIDNTAPTGSLSPTSNTTWTNSQSVTITASDANAGLESVQYAWTDSNTTPTSGWVTGTATATQTVTKNTENGKFYLHVKITDKAGNVKDISGGQYYIDIIGPTITLGTNSSTAYSKTKSVSFSTRDDDSGVSKTEYIWSTSTSTPTSGWTTLSSTATTISGSGLSGKYYLYVRSTDLAGNVSNQRSTGLFYFDNAAPTIAFSKNGNSTAVASDSTTITITDVSSTTTEYAWSTSATKAVGYKSTTSKSIATSVPTNDLTTYYLHVKSTDSLGNTSTKVSSVFNMTTTLTTAQQTEVKKTKCENRSVTETAASYFTTVDVTGGVKITGYSTSGPKDVVIPCQIGGKEVVDITGPTPYEGAFKFKSLTSVVLPNTLKTISGDSAFYYNNLTSITIPNSITSLGYSSFNLNSITSVILPDSIEVLAHYAFANNKISSVYLGSSVSKLNINPFYGNPNAKFYISNGNTKYKTDEKNAGIYTNDGSEIISGTQNVVNTATYNSIKTISVYAFNTNQLTSITIPIGVTSIGGGAFEFNPNLKTVVNKSSISNADLAQYFDSSPTITN